MYELDLKGSYYEMGVIQGKKIITGAYPGKDDILKPPNEKRVTFTDECEKLVRKYMPDFLNEIQGVADGSDIDFNLVRIWPISLYSEFVNSCSLVAISSDYTPSNKPLFIRNYDFLTSSQKDFTVFWTTPTNRNMSIGFCDFFSSRYGGVNDKGLAIGVSSSPYHKKPQPGITMNLATRWVLDNFSTTKEATDFLKTIPHFHGFNFLICDKKSNIARVETCPEKVEVITFEEGIGVSTNHYLSKKMQKFEIQDFGSSKQRFKNALIWFEKHKGSLTPENAISLTKSHKKGLCDHFGEGTMESGTIWSWIYSIGDPNILVSHGPPCKNGYCELSFSNN